MPSERLGRQAYSLGSLQVVKSICQSGNAYLAHVYQVVVEVGRVSRRVQGIWVIQVAMLSHVAVALLGKTCSSL